MRLVYAMMCCECCRRQSENVPWSHATVSTQDFNKSAFWSLWACEIVRFREGTDCVASVGLAQAISSLMKDQSQAQVKHFSPTTRQTLITISALILWDLLTAVFLSSTFVFRNPHSTSQTEFDPSRWVHFNQSCLNPLLTIQTCPSTLFYLPWRDTKFVCSIFQPSIDMPVRWTGEIDQWVRNGNFERLKWREADLMGL